MPHDDLSTWSAVRRRARVVLLGVSAAWIFGCAPQIGSVGAVLGQDRSTGRVLVRDVPPGMASAKAGLDRGDEILSIEGRDVRDMTPEEVAESLRGEVGSKVHLTIAHPNGTVERVTVTRGPFRRAKEPE